MAAAENSTQAQVPILRLLRSGGIRVDDQGMQVAFFVRQDPAQMTAGRLAAELRAASTGPSMAQRILGRHGDEISPLAPLFRQRFASMETAEATPEYQAWVSRPHQTVIWPTAAQRVAQKTEARANNWKRVGTSYGQRLDVPDELLMQALYADRILKLPHRSHAKVELATSRIELYELEAGSQGGTAPAEVQSMARGSAARLGAVVECYELGRYYLIFRATSKEEDATPFKRQLIQFSHGFKSDRETDLPSELAVSFDVLDGEALLAQTGSPLFQQDTRPASTHYRKNDGRTHVIEVFDEMDQREDARAMLEEHGGASRAGKLNNVRFVHFSSKLKWPETPQQKASAAAHALHDVKEMCAWLAYESGADVLYVRKSADQRTLLSPEGPGLEHLVGDLRSSGLIDDYSEVRLRTCRSPYRGPPSKLRGTHVNAPGGADATQTAELPVDVYESMFRTEFENTDDFVQYVAAERWKYLGAAEPEEAIPRVFGRAGAVSQETMAPHEARIDSVRPFDVLSLRKEGRPIAFRSDKVGVPLLTSNVLASVVVWIGATDKSGSAGAHVLCRIAPENVDPIDLIEDKTSELEQAGFSELKVACVTGAGVARTAALAGKVVEQLRSLGYQTVIDHTRSKLPGYVTERTNVGGQMTRDDDGRLEFAPIGAGIFSE